MLLAVACAVAGFWRAAMVAAFRLTGLSVAATNGIVVSQPKLALVPARNVVVLLCA